MFEDGYRSVLQIASNNFTHRYICKNIALTVVKNEIIYHSFSYRQIPSLFYFFYLGDELRNSMGKNANFIASWGQLFEINDVVC